MILNRLIGVKQRLRVHSSSFTPASKDEGNPYEYSTNQSSHRGNEKDEIDLKNDLIDGKTEGNETGERPTSS